MKQFVEKLFDKHLDKTIYNLTETVCKQKFDQIFKEVCDMENLCDTTLGETYARLREISVNECRALFDSKIEEINSEIYKLNYLNKENPFVTILDSLWYEFNDYLSSRWIEGYVLAAISDEYHEKQEQLYNNGVVDFHGDLIKG